MTKKIVKRTDANNETLYFYTHSDAVDVGEGSSTKSLTEVIDDTLHKSAQTLTNAEKTQVHANLGTESFVGDRAVRYDEAQVLGTSEKTQALTNLGLNGVDDVPTENSNNVVRSGGVKAAIDDVIDDFTNRGFMYKGIAPVSAPLGEDKTFYIAKSGEYSAYTGIGDGSFTLNGIAVLTYATVTTSGAWAKNDIVLFDEEPTTNSQNLVKSGGVQNELALGAVYDVSAKNPTAGLNNDGKFESLSALLSDANLNTLIPIAIRKGGMSIKFVQSSDNNSTQYVQYRYMSASTDAADFTNVANWQGVDDELILGSHNLIEGGVVQAKTQVYDSCIDQVRTANLFDKTKIIQGGYINRDTGKIKSTAGTTNYFTTDFIPIDSAGCYAYQAYYGGTYAGYACYSAASESSYTHGGSSKQAVFQEGDAYVRFSCTDINNLDTFMVIRGTAADQPSEYKPYGYLGLLKDDVVHTNNIKDGAITLQKIGDDVLPEVVDNLTTNDSANPLSAAQGKVIADTTMEFVESFNILDPSTFIQDKTARRDNGELVSDSGCIVTDFIELTSAGLVVNHLRARGGNYYCGCVIYDQNKQIVSYTSPSSTGGSISIDPTGHDDWKFVRLNLKGAPEGEGYAAYRQLTLPTPSYQPYVPPYWKMKSSPLGEGEVLTDNIADSAVTIDKINEVVESFVSDNILDPASCTFSQGYYVNTKTGGINNGGSANYNGYTGYVPIDSRGVVFNKFYHGGTQIGGAVYYIDSLGNKIYKRGFTSKSVVYDGGNSSLPDTDPMHYPDAFVRFTINGDGTAENVMCNVGLVEKPYVPYAGIKKTISKDILPALDIDFDELSDNKYFTDGLNILLPKRFYAVRGDVLQLFHKGVIYAIDLANRYAKPSCSKGSQYRRYYELNASNVEFSVPSSASMSIGDTYSTQGNLYEVKKVSTGNPKAITCLLLGSASISETGTLTKVSGNGDDTVTYSKYTDTVAVGEYSYGLTIYDDNRNILGSANSIIKMVNYPTAPATAKNILCIGASTTAGGQWVCEAQRRLLGTDINPSFENSPRGNGLDRTKIKFIGSLSKTLYGETAHFFAKSGWGWKDYATAGRYAIRFYLEGSNNVNMGAVYTNNGHSYEVIELNTIDGVETIRCATTSGNTPSPHGDNVNGTLTLSSGGGDASLTYIKSEVDGANPFWNQDHLDFANYVENICGETHLDMIITVLGTNGLFGEQEEYIRTFIEAVHADYPDCKIILAGSTSPSMINMMPGYGATGNFADTYLVKYHSLELYELYKTIAEDYDYVEYESWTGQFDSDYNFPLTQKNVNTRNNTVQEPYANNTVHPGTYGYLQFADASYRSIVAHICQ